MIADAFWKFITSAGLLSLDGLILAAAAAVGYTPLIRYLPVIGAYVPYGRIATAIMAAWICFSLGYRLADERETLKSLRITLAEKQADLDNATKSAAFAAAKATEIESAADKQRQIDNDYIAKLQTRPACALDANDVGGVRHDGIRNRLRFKSPAPAGAK